MIIKISDFTFVLVSKKSLKSMSDCIIWTL